MKQFPLDKLQQIQASIDTAVQGIPSPIAVFDADGTLWDADLGENFFQYQFRNRLLKGLPADPWGHYTRLHNEGKEKEAYLWLAQINAGQSLKTVRQWAHQAFVELKPPPIFEGMKSIVEQLQKLKVKIFVITASIKWAVEPGAEFLGIPKENVLGIKTKVRNDIISNEQDGPITWKDGKVDGLLLETGGRRAFFAAGNSTGDLALLKSATHLRLAHTGASKDNVTYASERQLLEIAKEQSWFYQDYE